MTTNQRTLLHSFERSVEKYPLNMFLMEKRGESYEGITYQQVRTMVHACAAGLISLGLKKGDRVALISEGRRDWVVAELGILYSGGINVPLSVKIDERSELRFRLSHSGCRMVIVSGAQLQKVYDVRTALPELQKIILLDASRPARDDEILFSRLLESGRSWLEGHREEFNRRWASVGESDPATISYTSGTTADPKGIVLTHRNYTANIEQSVALYPLPEWFVTLLILPWDHAFAHTDGIYALGQCGGAIASIQPGKTTPETLRNIPSNIREIRPTFLLSVPSLAKNFRKNIEQGVKSRGAIVQALFATGLRIAYAYDGDGFSRGAGWRKTLRPLARLFDLILFRKIRANFGGRLQYFIGGGALLDIELQRFFSAIGIPMYQGYGLTEAAPVISANTPERHKFGTSGVLVPDLELRICDEAGRTLPSGQAGEIVVRGENVMAGYWSNERATAETIRDGWLHTGDLGYMDSDGFLVVLGREKSLLVGHDGEKYSPEGIEELIVSESTCIDQVMLYNSQSPYTVALVVPNREALLAWVRHRREDPESPEGLNVMLSRIGSEIDAFRPGGRHEGAFPERWLPSACAILTEPFTEQNRLLNSTLKMVRGRIAETHRDRLDQLFTPGGRALQSEENRKALAAALRK